MENMSVVWVRSLLAVYRQAAINIARDQTGMTARTRVLEALAGIQAALAAHEDLGSLWREVFGGSEEGVRAVFAPLIEAARDCDPESAMRALVEFAAEEIAALFEEGDAAAVP